MSMVKRATGKIEKFTNAEGEEIDATNLVWADEKKDETEVKVDPNAANTEGETKLSQEEINKLLKEGEQENPPK